MNQEALLKLVHFSDLHLDSLFAGFGRTAAVATKRRNALRLTLENICRLAQAEQADALLCGGDLYEHGNYTEDTLQFVRRVFAAIAPLPVYIAPGNHDWYGPASLYARAGFTPNVHVFDQDRLNPVKLGEGVTLWGAAHLRPAGTRNFLADFTTDGPGLHLGLFHGSEIGWFQQQREQDEHKEIHAPFEEKDIAAAGLHHALLGHYHRPKASPRLTYPGNPCPLSFGEDGERGAVVVRITGEAVLPEWRSVSAYNVHNRILDLTGCGDQSAVSAMVAQEFSGLSGCGRVTLTGTLPASCGIDLTALQQAVPGLDALEVRASAVRQDYDLALLRQQPTVQGQFVNDVEADQDMDEDTRRRVLISGLRALDGDANLEVL